MSPKTLMTCVVVQLQYIHSNAKIMVYELSKNTFLKRVSVIVEKSIICVYVCFLTEMWIKYLYVENADKSLFTCTRTNKHYR